MFLPFLPKKLTTKTDNNKIDKMQLLIKIFTQEGNSGNNMRWLTFDFYQLQFLFKKT